MGRNSGYLALMSSILGGAEVVITPERPMSMDEVAARMEDAYVRGKSHAITVIAEGAPYKTTDLASFLNQKHLGFEIRITILGHIQRGGSPSAFDRLLATRLGVKAVELLAKGESGVMVGLDGREISTSALSEVATKARTITDWYYDMAWILSR
jgi:6-phosphofructokinase 1